MTRLTGVLALCAALLGGAIAQAQSIVAQGQSFVTPRLMPGKKMPDGGRMAGLRLSMEPGWKTYWRSPGETGIPPRFDWSGSRNVAAVELHWPRPALFQSFGMRTAGYADVVVFPLEVTPVDPALPMQLALTAELGVCKDICVLEHVEAELAIQPGDAEIGARQVRSALRRVPAQANPNAVVVHACRFEGAGDVRRMHAELGLVAELSNPVVLVEHGGGAWIKDTRQRVAGERVEIEVDFALPEGQTWIDRSAFRMTVMGDEAAWDIQGCRAG